MRGTIVINISDEEDGILHTDIDVDVKNASGFEAVAVISHLARSLQIPLDLLPAALMMFNTMDTGSEHICVDKALIERAVDDVGD